MSDIRERVAHALGWTIEQTMSFSYQALRELVRPVDGNLASELTRLIQTGQYIVGRSR